MLIRTSTIGHVPLQHQGAYLPLLFQLCLSTDAYEDNLVIHDTILFFKLSPLGEALNEKKM
jgi:hypothetical protein